MNFDYFYTKQINDSLAVDDIGNCAIEACSDEGARYYLVIKTQLGSSIIFEYGPIIPEINLLPKTCTCSFRRIAFSENKLIKTIDGFLNNPYRTITQATIVDEAEVYQNCINIIDYVKADKDFL